MFKIAFKLPRSGELIAPQYPTPRYNPAYTGEPNGPVINKFRDLEPKWPALITKKMKDGGGNVTWSNDEPELRWELTYSKVSQDGSDTLYILDQHFVYAGSFAFTFVFRHPRTGLVYNGVRYETFEPDHGKRVWQQTRKITLVKWPS